LYYQQQTYEDSDKEKSDRKTFEFNKKINIAVNHHFGKPIMMHPDFEGYFEISRTKGNKLGKGLAALKHFQTINDEAIPEEMIQLLTLIYA